MIETDHIIPKSEGGTDEIENAIPLCFECHTEIHLYNDKHPKGRKYTPNELQKHKVQWIEICKRSPETFAQYANFANGGPFYGIIGELEFNQLKSGLMITYETEEFSRSIRDGSLSLLDDDLKEDIMATYALIKSTNQSIKEFQDTKETGGNWVKSQKQTEIVSEMKVIQKVIKDTLEKLKTYLHK
jgi:uncharacterized phage infection (PIP) family protein YhgE